MKLEIFCLKKVWIITLLSVLPLFAAAHPGHGVEGSALQHHLLSPVHAILFILLGVVLFGIYRLYQKKQSVGD
ncbi:MAG: hypothetical protein OEX02_06040 [Cyclobacteriaceae bacterium]|nr:hypothetical protein [Cyclobacteriaceae bacterium]